MHLIIILAALAVERFTTVGRFFQNKEWVSTYLGRIQQAMGKTSLWKDGLPIVCWILPMVLVTAILQFFLNHIFHGVLGYLFNFAVLLYCIGPSDLKQYFADYLTHKDSPEALKAAKNLGVLSPQSHGHPKDLSQRVSEKILLMANTHIFAILLAYLLFGAWGVVLYKFSFLLSQEGEEEHTLVTPYRSSTHAWFEILNWLPVRVTALLYALAGSFVGCFHLWRTMLLKKIDENEALLKACGFAAVLGAKESLENLPEGIEESSLQLVERSLMIVLALIALMTLVAWLH